MVKIKPVIAFNRSPVIKAWCDQVTAAPDNNKIKVLSKGISQGEKTSMPRGGQMPPICIVGAKLEWKKAQNQPAKKTSSVRINNNIPCFKPRCTAKVCSPSKVASITISLNHKLIDKRREDNPSKIRL